MCWKRVIIGIFCAVLFLISEQAGGTVYFRDGEVHNVSWSISDPYVMIMEGYDHSVTTVNLLRNGIMSNVVVWQRGQLNLLGGTINYLTLDANGQASIYSGEIIGGLAVHLLGRLSLSGGTINDYVSVSGEGYANISGGVIRGQLSVYESSEVYISDGMFDSIIIQGDSRCYISGGTIQGGIIDSQVNCHSVITIYGSGFNYPYGIIPDAYGTLTGVLSNGDPINTNFHFYTGGSIVLVPEPCTMSLLALGVVALLRKRRRS